MRQGKGGIMTGIEIAYNRFVQRLGLYGFSLSMPIEWFIIFSRKTQAQMVFWHLQNFKSITNQQAHDIYGIRHCPSVIRDLRDMFREKNAPYRIDNESIEGVNRWGRKTKYDEYTLRELAQ